MIRSRTALLGASLSLFAVLAAGSGASAGTDAAVAAAHPSCTGLMLNAGPSNVGIGFFFATDANSRKRVLFGGNTMNGTVQDPINRFEIHSGQRADIDYYDLRTAAFLATHTNVGPGIYNKNVCHYASVRLR
ncbi:hypothetical protein [Catenuloplanes indicus]|uniref:Uncharacterized protein n=1 Tax=Catenuloplanes indicus TaxID=137267 RepID=A0AAE3VUP6_9ACTN|nr:hypothetical protein [Catenuloplanes indicus]MDQ0363995.1 hypothetical protein [Catenuloplanes indicus]